MKKSLLMLVGLLFSIAAFADIATSVNAIGVMRSNLPAGMSLIACPFNAMGERAISLDEIFGKNLPYLSEVFIYVPESGYVIYRFVDGEWYDEGKNRAGDACILRGEGFWIYCPTAVSNLLFVGEVPASYIGTNRIDLVDLQIVSFAFPQNMVLTDCGLIPQDGDLIFKFSNSNGTYLSYRYDNSSGLWYDDNFASIVPVFKPNEGFWYMSKTTVTNTWNQVKTYPWP